MKFYLVLLIWFVLFWVRFWTSFQAEGNLRKLAEKKISVIGKISSEPVLQGSSQRFKIGRISVWTKQYPRYEYGQKVEIVGILQRRMINRYYSRFSLMYPSIKQAKTDRVLIIGFDWKKKIMDFRRRIEQRFNQALPEPEASLLAGIVLGAKRGLPRGFWRALQRTGTLHIVVASGYNVTVVMGTIIKYLAGWVRRRTAIILGLIAVVVYTLMAGAEAAIVRAAIMGSLAYLAQVWGRQADGVRLLLVAAAAMLVYEPLLIWDVGFQLSFAATAGLIFIAPLLDRFFVRVWLVGKMMSETLSAQIAVWPILLINFGQLSAFAVLVNSLILWLVPIVMGAGTATVVLGQPAAWLAYGPLTAMRRVIEWFGGQSWMSWPVKGGQAVGGLSWWWGWGYYWLLVMAIYFYRKTKLTDGDLSVRS
jgi:competence protein ComEC